MHRLTHRASIALAVLSFITAGVASAEAPLLDNRCVQNPALCSDEAGLAPGEVRVRSISAIASADGGPLLLTNRDLGISSDELTARVEESEPAAEPVEMAAVVEETEAAEPTEAADETPSEEAEAAPEAAGEPVDEEPEEAAAEPVPVVASEFSTDEDAVGEIEPEPEMGFEDCMESSIRGGNDFGESRRVCAVVFPE